MLLIIQTTSTEIMGDKRKLEDDPEDVKNKKICADNIVIVEYLEHDYQGVAVIRYRWTSFIIYS